MTQRMRVVLTLKFEDEESGHKDEQPITFIDVASDKPLSFGFIARAAEEAAHKASMEINRRWLAANKVAP